MKAKPFRDVDIGEMFRDIDGTHFFKTGKALTPVKTDEGSSYRELNCMIAIPNKPKDGRGQLRYKPEAEYCEVLEPNEEDSALALMVAPEEIIAESNE